MQEVVHGKRCFLVQGSTLCTPSRLRGLPLPSAVGAVRQSVSLLVVLSFLLSTLPLPETLYTATL